MSVEEELKKETEKWLSRIEKIKIVGKCEKGKEFVENIKAYVKDARYFLEKGDLIRAFECVVWAWAWIEIGKEMELIKNVKRQKP